MDAADFVLKWQESLTQATTADHVATETSPVSDLFEACSSFYRDILMALLQTPLLERSVFVSLQRSQSYLLLWAEGLGVSEGLLDASLKKSKRVQANTLRLLTSVSSTLTKGEWPMNRLQLQTD